MIAGLVTFSLVGCGGQETASTFSTGGGSNPLDGGVINDDGQDFEMVLEDDGSALKTVVVSGGDDEASIEFDGTAGGAAVPRSVIMGEDSFTVDRDAGLITVSVEAPFGLGRQTITAPLEGLDIFGTNARTINQEADCETIVASVDQFCELFLANADAALQEVIDIATGIAEEQLGSTMANSFIAEVITNFFKVIEDFCNAWTEMREGTSETPPVDPCA